MLPTLMLRGCEVGKWMRIHSDQHWQGSAIEPKVSTTNSCFDIAKYNPLVF